MRSILREIDDLTNRDVSRWDDALDSVDLRSPFLSHAFCRAVHDVRGGVRVLEIDGDGRGTAFLPFQMRRGRSLLRHAEQVGGSISDCFGVVGAVSPTPEMSWLLDATALSSLRFHCAIPELTPFAFADVEEQKGIRVTVKDFDSFIGIIARKDKDFVKTVSRSERQLVRDFGDVTFRFHAANPAAELEKLIAVKRSQYRRTGARDGFESRWKLGLLYRLLREPALSRCRPILSTMYCGDEWVAAHFGIQYGDMLHVWFPAYDLKFRRYGPGHVLFFKIIEYAVAQGIHRFDFGEGESSYKLKYQGEPYSVWKGVVRRSSISGNLDRVIQSCEWQINRISVSLRQFRRRGDTNAP